MASLEQTPLFAFCLVGGSTKYSRQGTTERSPVHLHVQVCAHLEGQPMQALHDISNVHWGSSNLLRGSTCTSLSSSPRGPSFPSQIQVLAAAPHCNLRPSLLCDVGADVWVLCGPGLQRSA